MSKNNCIGHWTWLCRSPNATSPLKKKIKSFGFDIKEKNSIIKKNMSYVSDLSSKQISAIKKENLFSMNNLEKYKEN